MSKKTQIHKETSPFCTGNLAIKVKEISNYLIHVNTKMQTGIHKTHIYEQGTCLFIRTDHIEKKGKTAKIASITETVFSACNKYGI